MYKSIHFLVVCAGMSSVCFGQLQKGYSSIQYDYRLGSRTIDTYAQISFLDCVEECLVTTRCKSVNYYKGVNYCETNYENKTSAVMKYLFRPGWVYSERADWPQDLAGPCASSNCDINQKCRYNRYSENNSFDCILSDCGIPQKYGVDLDNMQQGEAIAINRGMHVKCSDGFKQFGSGRLVCRPSGEWNYRIKCVEEDWSVYDGHHYKIFKEVKNWTDAKADCESIEAYLVEIDSRDENKWIKNELTRQLTQQQPYEEPFGVWIGGFRESNVTDFRWAGSKQFLNYSNWQVPNPDNYLNKEYCIQLLNQNDQWNDQDCSKTYPYICEKITTLD